MSKNILCSFTLILRLRNGYCAGFISAATLLLIFTTLIVPRVQADVTQIPPQLETIQRQEQERLRRDQEAQIPSQDNIDGIDTTTLHPPGQTLELPLDCHYIKNINILGADLLSDSDKDDLIEQFVDKCLTAKDIEQLLAALTKKYIDAGYISSRAYLPPQDLSQGQLRIVVLEGIIEKTMVEDGNADSISLGNILPGAQGEVLNLHDLEQAIDQINRLPSNNAVMDIRPGSTAGTSQVVFKNDPGQRWQMTLSTDNQGQPSTGEKQTGVGGSVDNIFGLNDQLTLNYRRSIPGDRESSFSDMAGIGISIPYGYSLLSFNVGNSRYTSTLTTPGGLDLKASGDNKINTLSLNHVLYRDQARRITTNVNLTTKESRNYLNDQFLGVSSRKLTVLDLDLGLRARIGTGLLSTTLGYVRGLNILGALDDPDDLPTDSPHAQFSLVTFNVDYRHVFELIGQRWSVSTSLLSQQARDPLYGSEQISIGGLYSVRGHIDNSLAGDDGYYWRNELSLIQPFNLFIGPVEARWTLAYDVGAITNHTPDIPQGRMTGSSVGVSMSWNQFVADAIYTLPLSVPDFMRKESGHAWFRLTYRL